MSCLPIIDQFIYDSNGTGPIAESEREIHFMSGVDVIV